MNIAGALLKQILELQDFETWTCVRKNYLPSEYHSLHTVIERHSTKFYSLPTFEDLKYEIRDSRLREQVYAIESIPIDIEPYVLLEYLKNEYTQKEVFQSLDKYIESSIAFEDAEETVAHLHQIVLDIEDKVDLRPPEESMQRIKLFDTEEDLAKFLPLGLNDAYDYGMKFSPKDLILIGGRRGSGKSITCSNIANNVFDSGKSALYFTIEMDSRQILQRCCAIATGVPFSRLRSKQLSVSEWESVASWWANRFEGGEDHLNGYKMNHDFDNFHNKLTTSCKLHPQQQLDVIYDASLTLPKIRAELDKKVETLKPGVILVDYINQVKRSSLPSRQGQYEWTEQIEIAKALKEMAQEYEVPVVSPYQTDATGEARFAKGLLDAADAAFSLETWDKDDECITFNCVKMRNAPEIDFTSKMDWNSLRIGPESAQTPKEKDDGGEADGESAVDNI